MLLVIRETQIKIIINCHFPFNRLEKSISLVRCVHITTLRSNLGTLVKLSVGIPYMILVSHGETFLSGNKGT